jgi:hypothetical protein
MEVPEDVRVGLANIRPTLRAKLNRTARVVGRASFDANGAPRKVEHDPRWELWDTDEDGREYRVTTLEGPDGGFIPLGTWVLQLMHDINPANYGGDIHEMIERLVDRPNQDVERLGQKTYEEFLDYLADLCWAEGSRSSRITVPLPMV